MNSKTSSTGTAGHMYRHQDFVDTKNTDHHEDRCTKAVHGVAMQRSEIVFLRAFSFRQRETRDT